MHAYIYRNGGRCEWRGRSCPLPDISRYSTDFAQPENGSLAESKTASTAWSQTMGE